jgi:cobalt/nickel transport system permease protein
MVCDTFLSAETPVHRLDPRVRILAAAALAVAVVAAGGFAVPAAGLAAGIALAAAARLPLRPMLRRLVPLNALMLLLAAVLSATMGGEALWRAGPVELSRAGALRGAGIALKANAVVLIATALLSTIEPAMLAHALARLRVPRKLTHLLFFTVRYLDVLHHEYYRLRTAMRARCFRPRTDAHTFRSYGYLVGMLLVRSFDRSDRILAAMKCRGFRGRFAVLDRLCFRRRDGLFAAGAIALIAAMGILEWLWPAG